MERGIQSIRRAWRNIKKLAGLGPGGGGGGGGGGEKYLLSKKNNDENDDDCRQLELEKFSDFR